MSKKWDKDPIPASMRYVIEHDKRMKEAAGGSLFRVIEDMKRFKGQFATMQEYSSLYKAAEFSSQYFISSLAAETLNSFMLDINTINHSWLMQAKQWKLENDQMNKLSSLFVDDVRRAAELTVATQSLLSCIDWEGINEMKRMSDLITPIVENSFISMNESYSRFQQSLGDDLRKLAELPPTATNYPPIELHTSAYLMHELVNEKDEPPAENYRISEEISEDCSNQLEHSLQEISPDLVNLLLGAKQAYSSNNPDKQRHVIVSLRELITSVLHKLAPDNELNNIKEIYATFNDGRPTRRSRLLFICRDINSPPFCEFIQNDVNASLEFIELFHRGTHTIKNQFTESQLKALITKTETLLVFLLERSKEIQ